MTPGARVQAAIECLDAVIAAARAGGAAADTIVQRYFLTRRYAGSKDRRAVRDLVFAVIRAMGDVPVSGRAAMIGFARTTPLPSRERPGEDVEAQPRPLAADEQGPVALAPSPSPSPAGRGEILALFGTSPHAPGALVAGEAEAAPSLAPNWQLRLLGHRFGKDTVAEATALLDRAPLDVRVNTLAASRDGVLAELPGFAPLAFAPDGLRAPEGTRIDDLPAYNQGRIEVQDEGSQLAALAVGAQPGETVIDLCAGAGGKTLALAATMANDGRLIASDTDRGRLDAMEPRLARAAVSIVERRLLDPRRELAALDDLRDRADRVLIDAPCSGTGTWRRNPEARWRLTAERLAKLEAEQARLLGVAAALVRPGGTITYVVCSLLPSEGEARVEAFLSTHPGFAPQDFHIPVVSSPVTRLALSPRGQGCDGFFIAGLRRVC